eukprot:1645073-Pyramimonas_sp.AAC.1
MYVTCRNFVPKEVEKPTYLVEVLQYRESQRIVDESSVFKVDAITIHMRKIIQMAQLLGGRVEDNIVASEVRL